MLHRDHSAASLQGDDAPVKPAPPRIRQRRRSNSMSISMRPPTHRRIVPISIENETAKKDVDEKVCLPPSVSPTIIDSSVVHEIKYTPVSTTVRDDFLRTFLRKMRKKFFEDKVLKSVYVAAIVNGRITKQRVMRLIEKKDADRKVFGIVLDRPSLRIFNSGAFLELKRLVDEAYDIEKYIANTSASREDDDRSLESYFAAMIRMRKRFQKAND